MHYYLADQEAQRREPNARALLLDQEGFVMEASTANLLIYRQTEGLISPPREKILPGVSVAVLQELAAQLQIPFGHRSLRVEDVQSADEVLLCSTSPCMLPVSTVDGVAIHEGQPGAIFQQLISAWSDLVGVDIIAQAQQFRDRR
jgi:branched-subunit amino acid aminotransferase/4-amino-4-deoxychorismate lyase